MLQVHKKHDEIKRKLRALKRLEVKLRLYSHDIQNINKRSMSKSMNMELVWEKFFDLKDLDNNNVRYPINRLLFMTKDEFKEVINEYFYYVYYLYYKENGVADGLFDAEILEQLGIPLSADIDVIKKKFRELAKTYHPDNGGNSAKFIELMEKYKNLSKRGV